jgi:N6-adenosine-specific RNA methylase IME4
MTASLPAGPFGTIVADPPWNVRTGPLKGRAGFGDCMSGPSRPLAYPTMTVDEIKALPVADVAAADAHLYLWVVNAYVESAFAVARAWGFDYSTLLTWSKRPMGAGLGGTWGLSSEHVLFCRRGRTGRGRRAVGTVFTWKRPYDHRGKPKHSAKPPQFFDVVTVVSPGPRLELFAREPRLGWTTWGNELAPAPPPSPSTGDGK